jgi:hypothetical protein
MATEKVELSDLTIINHSTMLCIPRRVFCHIQIVGKDIRARDLERVREQVDALIEALELPHGVRRETDQ